MGSPPADREDLHLLLLRRCGSEERKEQYLAGLSAELGIGLVGSSSRVLDALGLIRLGGDSEMVARALSWAEFEEFCGRLLKAAGFQVVRNLILRKPRMQVDILAKSDDFSLSVDCKHWKRAAGSGMLARIASDQLLRSRALRAMGIAGRAPIASVILTLTQGGPRFVDGVAVVPLFLLKGFLASYYEVRENLKLV